MSNVKEVSSGFKLGDIKALLSQLKKENIKKISSDLKNEKFNFKEIWAIILLSVRRYYWQPNHKEAHKKVPTDNFITAAMWLGSWLFPLGIVLCAAYPLTSLKMTLELLSYADGILMVLSVLLTQLFTIAILWLVFLPICICVTFNIGKLCKNLHYVDSAWYRNTGIRPSQVTSDVGAYGEYIATCAAEDTLRNNKVYGKVFNNVFIPKKDGSFNEVDTISVSELGIHVIEAKARTGLFSGTLLGEYWIQNNEHKMQNPLKQNLGHCNFLTEYLYEQLPSCKLKEQDLFEKLVNVALFALYGVQDNISAANRPNMAFFSGMADVYAVHQYKERLLTKQEVDMICAILDKISHYSPHQREQMIQEREEAYARGDFKRNYEYYIVTIEFPWQDGKRYETEAICKDNGIYKTYADNIDGWYRAMPNGAVKRRSNSTRDESAAKKYYQKIMTQ